MTTHTIITAKGRYTGTLREVCAWQAEYQAAYASIDGVSVDAIDFDPEDLSPAIRAVRAALAAAAAEAEQE